jgi:hypothetical protein
MQEMEGKGVEGFKWLLLALLPGAIAAMSPNPLLKFGAGLTAAVIMAKAGGCFQTAAREAYQQLDKGHSIHQLKSDY